MEKHLSACRLEYHFRFRYATHVGPAFLDITKDGISDTDAPATCAEAALYDLTLLLRLRLRKVVQPLIVFVIRHCDKIERVQGDVGKQKVEPTIERTSSSCRGDIPTTAQPFEPLCSSNRRCTRSGLHDTCLAFNLHYIRNDQPFAASGGV